MDGERPYLSGKIGWHHGPSSLAAGGLFVLRRAIMDVKIENRVKDQVKDGWNYCRCTDGSFL